MSSWLSAQHCIPLHEQVEQRQMDKHLCNSCHIAGPAYLGLRNDKGAQAVVADSTGDGQNAHHTHTVPEQNLPPKRFHSCLHDMQPELFCSIRCDMLSATRGQARSLPLQHAKCMVQQVCSWLGCSDSDRASLVTSSRCSQIFESRHKKRSGAAGAHRLIFSSCFVVVSQRQRYVASAQDCSRVPCRHMHWCE